MGAGVRNGTVGRILALGQQLLSQFVGPVGSPLASAWHRRSLSPRRYDPAADLRALAASDWQGPTGASPYCPMAAALDAAAGWAPPTGPSPYCPLSAAFTAEPPAKAARWDPLAWLLDGWAAGSGRWDVPEGVPAQHAGGGKSAAVGRSDNDGTLDFSFA